MQSEPGHSAYDLLMNCVDPPTGSNSLCAMLYNKEYIDIFTVYIDFL